MQGAPEATQGGGACGRACGCSSCTPTLPRPQPSASPATSARPHQAPSHHTHLPPLLLGRRRLAGVGVQQLLRAHHPALQQRLQHRGRRHLSRGRGWVVHEGSKGGSSEACRSIQGPCQHLQHRGGRHLRGSKAEGASRAERQHECERRRRLRHRGRHRLRGSHTAGRRQEERQHERGAPAAPAAPRPPPPGTPLACAPHRTKQHRAPRHSPACPSACCGRGPRRSRAPPHRACLRAGQRSAHGIIGMRPAGLDCRDSTARSVAKQAARP